MKLEKVYVFFRFIWVYGYFVMDFVFCYLDFYCGVNGNEIVSIDIFLEDIMLRFFL